MSAPQRHFRRQVGWHAGRALRPRAGSWLPERMGSFTPARSQGGVGAAWGAPAGPRRVPTEDQPGRQNTHPRAARPPVPTRRCSGRRQHGRTGPGPAAAHASSVRLKHRPQQEPLGWSGWGLWRMRRPLGFILNCERSHIVSCNPALLRSSRL